MFIFRVQLNILNKYKGTAQLEVSNDIGMSERLTLNSR